MASETQPLEQVRHLATVPIWRQSGPSAASVFGLGRASAYRAAERGEIPTIKIGGRLVVPVPALLRMLGDEAGDR